MSRRSKLLFLLLLIVQAAHSVEEYVTRLFDVFAPARFIGGLMSDDLAFGFAIANIVLIAIFAWCYVVAVRAGGRAGRFVAIIWVAIELVNGVGHTTLSVLNRGYFSGAVTAVFLLVAATSLGCSLIADDSVAPSVGSAG
jgi:Protein of unknown function with HXXEE motif